jgi:lysophospholipase L1-like esterase
MRRRGVIAGVVALVSALVVGCAPPRPPVPAGSVLAIGDSVMVRAAPALAARGIAVDAVTSRQFKSAVPLVGLLAAAGRLPKTVVVHLGTNGSFSMATCDALVAAVGPRTLVFVNVNLDGRRSWEPAVNATLAACAARHHLRLVNWKGYSTGRPWFEPDHIHLTANGAVAYADLIRASL